MCNPPWFVALTPEIPEPEATAVRKGYDYWDLLGVGREPFIVPTTTIHDPGIPLGSLLIIALAKPDEVVVDKNGAHNIMETQVYWLRNDPMRCITVARVIVDPAWLEDAVLLEIESTARHEAGHMLGLRDDRRYPGSLMHWTQSSFDVHPIAANPMEIAEVERQYPIPPVTPKPTK